MCELGNTAKAAAFVERTLETVRMRHLGHDALDLLHRLTTADLISLEVGEARQTIMLNERGRILDVFLVMRESETSLLLLSDIRHPSPLLTAIDKYTIIEDASLVDISEDTAQVSLFGDDLDKCASDLSNDGWTVIERSWHDSTNICNIWEIITERGKVEKLKKILSEMNLQEANSKEFGNYRIMKGIPAVGHELTDAVNPLEAGLKSMISFDKGCYIGQEVVARLDTYGKTQRSLTGLRSQNPLTEGALLKDGTRKVGVVCSCANLPKYGYIGLGFVRKGYETKGTILNAEGVEASIAQIPFSSVYP